MLYLILSILGSAMISIVMRLSDGNVKSKLWMLAMNYLTCSILSWGLMKFGNPFPQESGLLATLGMGTFNGLFFMLALVANQYNISVNGVILSSVFSKLGALLIPLFISILMFDESPTVFQLIGTVLSVISILVLNYRKEEDRINGIFKWALLALLLAEGCAGIMSKVFHEVGNEILESHFLFYTFVTAFLFCLVMILQKKERCGKKEVLYGILIGLPNFMASRFVLKALESVAAVVVYPSKSVATIVVISLAGIFMFKERLTKQQIVAMGVILVSLVLLNI